MCNPENNNREQFLKAYANLPLNTRKEIVLVLEEEGKKQPITWEVVYFEVKNNTARCEQILEKLKGLGII
ncbi:MAG: hypothetical protein NTW18_05060 [Candidatus Omnitrophica bacterium]|nr:hypothetical protein [Candidatus Omnitrophota bacterium]